MAGGATSPTTVKNTASPTAVTAAIPIAVGNSRSLTFTEAKRHQMENEIKTARRNKWNDTTSKDMHTQDEEEKKEKKKKKKSKKRKD